MATATTGGMRSQSQTPAAAVNFDAEAGSTDPTRRTVVDRLWFFPARGRAALPFFSFFFFFDFDLRTKVAARRYVPPKKAILVRGRRWRGGKKQNSSKVSLHTDRHRRHLWDDGRLGSRRGEGAEPARRRAREEPVRGGSLAFSSSGSS